MRFVNINFEQIRQSPMGGWYTAASAQPSWVLKLAALAAAIIVFVPVLLLALAGVLAFAIVFIVGGLVHRAGAALSGLFSARPDDGRRNVRVVRHDS
ncbi:MAG: hypothetical protein GC159_23210 [Phycisphaera sp.]|nr:hypothetical protein [Phycisphaera sp.]